MLTPKILSRHPSHNGLRGVLPQIKERVIVRFGSSTSTENIFPKLKMGYKVIELNTVDAIKNSASKLKMKQKFNEANIKQSKWGRLSNVCLNSLKETHFQFNTNEDGSEGLEFPVVVKHIFGSRGSGNYKINNGNELSHFIENKEKSISNYIVEEFFSGMMEYRLHIAKDYGCFYTCRKMLKQDTPQDKRWFRNDSNSVWILESNSQFNKPSSFKDIIQDCLKALEKVGLDFAAFDVKVQSSKDSEGITREYQNYIIIECNSAPSFGEETLKRYKQVIPVLIKNKINK